MSLKNGANMSQREKFELINSEVRSFYEYCKEAGISDEEMDIICRPLTNAVRKASFKWWTRVFLFLVMVIAISFTVSQTDTFQWHASAVTRTLLIKLLPVWDWTPLYNNRCLVEKSRPPAAVDGNVVSAADCIACEAISKYLLPSYCKYDLFSAFSDSIIIISMYHHVGTSHCFLFFYVIAL